jgi:hypothetical protein
MSGHRTRRRRGHPKGKAYGFNNLRPAQKSSSSTQSGGSTASTSTPSTSTPSTPSSGS